MPRKDEPWAPAPMVGWYDPRQLVTTAIQVGSSSLFAENADGRLVQPLFDPLPAPYDERRNPDSPLGDGAPRSTLTIDYIADTGDGFDSTYGVAYWATEPELRPRHTEPVTLARGDVLVLGGDEVYPAASGDEYARRLVLPLEMASAEFPALNAPALYAIPGNHDWYDNLVAFTRLFIRERKIGKFRSRQRRSYFALELVHGWWLLAPDVQLGSDIDETQYGFFEDVARKLPPDARVIVCTAEPHWVYENEALRSGTEEPRRSRLLLELEELIDGETGRIRALIAGDLHHYRRHVGRVGRGAREVQLITAGGGGAFLHPTHGWRDGSDPARLRADAHLPPGLPGYRLEAAYPAPAASRKLAWKILGFPLRNGWFLASSAAVYGVVALQIVAGARLLCADHASQCAAVAANLVGSPGVVTLVALIVAGFRAFTDTSSLQYRRWAGLLHGLSHAGAAVAIPSLAVASWTGTSAGLALVTLVASTAIGAIVGSLLMGLYLFVSLNVFGRHRNEAFSALRESGFKNFLRMRIDEAGTLHVFAIGIDAPPTDWTPPLEGKTGFEEGRRSPTRGGSVPEIVDYVALG